MKHRATRIYDQNKGVMVYPKEGTMQGVCIGMDGYAMQLTPNGVMKLDKVVVMYATGMSTPDGTQMWEGDIIDADIPVDFDGMVSYMQTRGVMVWDMAGARWLLKLPKGVMQQVGDFQVANPRVVGNIWEHKNLIKDE